MQNQLERVRSSWTYNHPQLIVIISLVVVILWQNYAHHLPTVSLTSVTMAHNEPTAALCEPTDIECLLEEYVTVRSEVILHENVAEWRTIARHRARIEVNELMLDYTLNSTNHD